MTAAPDPLFPAPCPLSPPSCLLTFRLRNDVAIEDFGERSLALLCGALELREINAGARKILGLVDGGRTVGDIAGAAEMAVADVTAALLEMEQQGIVRRVVDLKKEGQGQMSAAKYLVDPDVSFRQEDDDGGILYDVKTDALEVINPTATEIWKFLAAPRTPAEVVAHLLEVCEGAPREAVEKDVAEFLASMLKKGFIGAAEDPA